MTVWSEEDWLRELPSKGAHFTIQYIQCKLYFTVHTFHTILHSTQTSHYTSQYTHCTLYLIVHTLHTILYSPHSAHQT